MEGLLATAGRGKSKKYKDWPYRVLLPFALNRPASLPQSAATGGRGGGHRWLELYLLSPIRSHRAQLALPCKTIKQAALLPCAAVQSSPCQ